ncbi:outer membrane beta-barrel protein [Helicobacter felis]|uniref:Outer membrane protein, Hom family n=1 Tax=Helicobacter felis (strain ATCC 49179 / CCUG 28539 / NCTC 12436 / CS1) TaxID=936155 RepID=E7A9A3_HELFC|nr:outer membrane protein, Hom family [Helicobacter felis ATCC 49179]
MVIRSLVMWFCVFTLSLAHPSIASYLDGSFFSVGLDLGGGDALENERVIPDTNTTKQQIYNTNLQSYDEAINNLKINQTKTIAVLKNLAQQLTDLNPTSSTLDTLIKQIDGMISDPSSIDLEAITSSVSAYNAYLQKTLTQYKDANQQLLIQAQQTIDNYEKQIAKDNAINQSTLQNALTTIDQFNSKMKNIANALKITYTPIPLPKSLQNCSTPPTCVSNLSPKATIQALSSMSENMKNVVVIVGNDINTMDQANQKLAIEYASEYNTLKTQKQNAINNALDDVNNIVKTIASGFSSQWKNFGLGQDFLQQNGNTNEIGKYVNAADTCVFQIIIYNNMDSTNTCGYGGGTTAALQSFQATIHDYKGLTAWAVWDSIFDLNKLKNNVFITPSDCSSGGCSGVSPQTSIDKVHDFFNFMNGYVGNISKFSGNFLPSDLTKPPHNTLYSLLENDLNSNNFTLATDLVNTYTNTLIPDMLNMFALNPVWLMSTMPSAQQYCQDNLTKNLPFSQGYSACQYNSWAQATFLGYFGYVNQQSITDLITSKQLNTSLVAAQNAISDATKYNNQLNALKKPNNLSISPPSYAINPVPMPALPTINTGGTPLPDVIKPQVPLLVFSSRSLKMHPLQMGLQAKWGYQKYFNPFFGISYYSSMSYRYLYINKLSADSNLNAINHYAFGIGTNLLFNVYSKIRKPRFGHPIIRTYGFFTGLLGVFNLYNVASLGSSTQFWRKSANIDGVFGLSMRVDRFKWMLGVKIPFINSSQLISISGKNGTETLSVIDNYKSSNLFLDFLTFF